MVTRTNRSIFVFITCFLLLLILPGVLFGQIEGADNIRSAIEELREANGLDTPQQTQPRVYVSKREMMSIVRMIVEDEADVIWTGEEHANVPASPNPTDVLILTFGTTDPYEQPLLDIFNEDQVFFSDGVSDSAYKDFGDYTSAKTNYWLSLENMSDMIARIAAGLTARGYTEDVLRNGNYVGFELSTLRDTGTQYFEDVGRPRSNWVALTPDVHYIIDNLGVNVGLTIQDTDGTFISGPELATIEFGIMDGEYAGIVCAEHLKEEEAGQIAIRMGERSETPVTWVRTIPRQHDSYLSMQSYNMAAMISGINYERPDKLAKQESTAWGNIVWLVVMSCAAIYIIFLNKRVYELSNMPVPVFDKDRRKKKKK